MTEDVPAALRGTRYAVGEGTVRRLGACLLRWWNMQERQAMRSL
ncbi:hypothetical protein ABZ783_30390 [Micromonospora sp. NPDC047738]